MSFGLSRGKQLLTDGYGVLASDLPPFENGRIDPRQWFELPSVPLEIEIGCGKGTFLLQQAKQQHGVNFLGIESAGEFFRFAADRIRRHQMNNVRILHSNAVEFMRYWCANGVAHVVHLYFSDPWPKQKHHKRRVINDRSLQDIHRILVPNGELRIVTDHEELWGWYLDHAKRHENLFERRSFATPSFVQQGEIIGTNFERKYREEGRPFFSMTLRRRENSLCE